MQDSGQQKGFALAAAVLALVVVGALVTGGFYAASQESRMSHATVSAERAFNFAERGLHEGLGVYRKTDVQRLEGDSTTELDTTYVLESDTEIVQGDETVGAYTLWIRRLGSRLYLLGSEGTVHNAAHAAGVKRTVGVMVRTRDLNFPMNTALQISDSLTIAGNASIDGTDHPPTVWEDCDSLDAQAGLSAPDTTVVTREGASHELTGDPPMAEDTTITDDDYTDFGDLDFDALAAGADFELGAFYDDIAPVEVDGVCDTSLDTNWGAPTDPTHPCHYYFPTLYRDGNLTIQGNDAGQGILLVDGDLDLSGGFEFYGIVIVNGSLTSTGTGSKLNGIVMVSGGATLDTDSTSTEDESVTEGNSIINFSSCAIQRAQDYNSDGARLVPIRERSWLDLSAIGSDGRRE
ncbi:MAG: hypothetical protein ACOC8B_01705 [Gemmatimonadota bacterium]